ncbi:TPR-like protein [Tilletiaria anomala UBC 951]|uniref:TPR-like protein n=1 Tax=Tilletiaria anomala (strain ATCC 24038 / CBS 436.72 / UBC 951) TaxID=1037660 RepID=A0A066VWJ5_TILAU|nr:TPR-like protein [Tilletiaria anomala UBC 951]KDN46107.1 TPR-like protein [Tilletiaria anomala UBC 951]
MTIETKESQPVAAATDDHLAAAGNCSAKKAAPTPEDIVEAEKCKAEGNAAFQAARWQDAVSQYSKAIDHDSTQAAYYTNRAAAYMSLKKFIPALADCQQASALQSDSSAKTLVRMARCHFSLGQVTQAHNILSKIISSGASPSAASTSSATTFSTDEVAAAKSLEAQVKRLSTHLDQYASYRNSKNWTLASIALDKAMQEIGGEENAPLAWKMNKADLLLRKGHLDAASSAATDLLRSDSHNSDALVLRARVLMAKGELAKAIAHAQAALRSDPDCKAARSILKKSRKLDNIKAEGNAAFKAGNIEDAIEKYTAALTAAEEDVDEDGELKGLKATLLSNRATANSKLGKHEETVEDCDTALQLDSGYVKALRTRARAQLKLEKYEEAVRDFKQALEESSIGVDRSAETEALRRELRNAELDLKRSKKKDYYKILGVEKSATDAEIKKAYRKESLKHHPDKGGDSEKFKLCSEAYSILSDDTKRRRYDAGADDPENEAMDPFGGMGGMGGFGGHGGFSGMGGMGGINLADILGSTGGHPSGSSFAGAGGPFGGGAGGSASGFGAGARRRPGGAGGFHGF